MSNKIDNIHWRTDAKAETPILWPPDVKNWLIGKDPDAGKDWRLEEKGMTAGGQREELRPWQRSWGRRLGICKGMIKPQEIPCSRASIPKTTVCLLYCFMLLPIPLTLWGAVPHQFSRRRSNVQLQFSSVQWLSRVWLFETPWIAAQQASLSITISRSSLRLTSIESMMPSSHLILGRPLLLLPPIPPGIRVFPNESTLLMRWPKYWRYVCICTNNTLMWTPLFIYFPHCAVYVILVPWPGVGPGPLW